MPGTGLVKGPILLQKPVKVIPVMGSTPDVVESDTDGERPFHEEASEDAVEEKAEEIEAESTDTPSGADVVTVGCVVVLVMEDPELTDGLCEL